MPMLFPLGCCAWDGKFFRYSIDLLKCDLVMALIIAQAKSSFSLKVSVIPQRRYPQQCYANRSNPCRIGRFYATCAFGLPRPNTMERWSGSIASRSCVACPPPAGIQQPHHDLPRLAIPGMSFPAISTCSGCYLCLTLLHLQFTRGIVSSCLSCCLRL